MFEISVIFKEAFEVVKRNYILAVPTVIATFVVTFLALALLKNPENMTAMATMGLVGLAFDFFAHGVTIAMAREALATGQTSIKTGASVAAAFFIHFVVTSVAIAAVVSVGFMLLILPGLVAMFFLMFVFPAIVMHGLGPVDAMKYSYRLVRSRLNDSLMLFIAITGITIGLGLINLTLASVPIVGQFVSVILTGLFGGFSAVVVLRAFIILDAAKPAMPTQ